VFGYRMGRATAACIRSRLRPAWVPSCAERLLGVLPGIVGSIQAMETIKLILGTGERSSAAAAV